jgi:hypothetical protein
MRQMRGFAGLMIACLVPLSYACAETPDARTAVLVELFTSEGCSSCPPADALLQAIDRQQPVPGAHVIVLSEHVDYWNYEGWSDPFSSSDATERQKTYAARFSQREGPYTPEAVVDGAKGVNGSDNRALIGAIEEAAQRPKLEIALANPEISGKSLEVTVTAPAHPHGDLYAVLADDHDQSSVARGENAGRRLEHVAVMRSIRKLGSLDKGFDRQIRLDLPHSSNDKMRLVVFAEERGTGHILGVTETGL